MNPILMTRPLREVVVGMMVFMALGIGFIAADTQNWAKRILVEQEELSTLVSVAELATKAAAR